jgi:hypothetical protein
VAPLPAADEVDVRRARRAAGRAWDRRIVGGRQALGLWRRQMLSAWRMAFDPVAEHLALGTRDAPMDPRRLGEIAAMMDDTVMREAVRVEIGGDSGLADRWVASPADPSLGAEVLAFCDPRAGFVLEPSRAEAAEILFTHAVVHATIRRRGSLFGMLAWLAWGSGDGVRAGIACERAMACPEVPPLARLIGDMLQMGLSPRRPERAKRILTGGLRDVA